MRSAQLISLLTFTFQIISPSWYHFRYAPGRAYTKEAYSSDEEYFADAAKAYQVELKILYDAGLRNVQIDDPNLACECSLSSDIGCIGLSLELPLARLLLRVHAQRLGRRQEQY